MPRTLWEKFQERFRGPAENAVYNPCGLKVGQRVALDVLDLRDSNWKVEALVESKYQSGGREFQHTAYLIGECGQNTRQARLMAIPQPAGGYQLVLLTLYHEQAYDPGLEAHLKNTDQTGVFECFEDGKLVKSYARIGGAKGGYTAQTRMVHDADGNGRAEHDEVVAGRVMLWDFWREGQDEAGQPQTEYFFVEIEGGEKDGEAVGDGWISMYAGTVIDLGRVVEF